MLSLLKHVPPSLVGVNPSSTSQHIKTKLGKANCTIQGTYSSWS